MPAYLMIGQPMAKGQVYTRGSIHAMRGFSEDTIAQLVETGVIREIITPPIVVFVKLKKHARLLKKQGVETLGDFAVAPISNLSKIKNAKALQTEVLELINPNNAVGLDDCDCTRHETPLGLPTAT
jgi:hypothetical protein